MPKRSVQKIIIMPKRKFNSVFDNFLRDNCEKKILNIYLKNMFGKLNCFKLILNIFRYILIIILCHVLSIL